MSFIIYVAQRLSKKYMVPRAHECIAFLPKKRMPISKLHLG